MNLAKKDIFDRIKLDIFDRVELPVEQKVAFSQEMGELVRDEIRKEIAKIPVGKIIARVMERELEKQEAANGLIKASVSREIQKAKGEVKNEIAALKKEETEALEKIRAKYSDLKNGLLSQPAYQFGGFAPPNPLNHTGEFLKNTDGTWQGLQWAAGGGGASLSGYTVTNPNPLKTFDVSTTSIDELARVVGSIIDDLQP